MWWWQTDGEILTLLKQILAVLKRIDNRLAGRYRVHLTQEKVMAITVGSSGSFAAQLEDNGAAIALPSGSTFAWSSSDPTALVSTGTDTSTATVTIPAGSTETTITLTASTTAPDGSTVSGTLVVDITPATPHVFTVTITQTA
jgi:hypothetical protein